MKHLFFLIVVTCACKHTFAQNVGIGTNRPMSKLHVAGDLRVDSLSGHDSGLVIHNKSGVLTSLKFTGNKSDVLRGDGTFQSSNLAAAAAPYWLTTGNSGTNPDSNFIGTTDDVPLKFRVNNMNAGEISYRNWSTALGVSALYPNRPENSTGQTAIGYGALQISSGSGNTAVGAVSLYNNSTGNFNTATGIYSLHYSNGSRNSAFGVSALATNRNSYDNCAIGYLAMQGNQFGVQNTVVGSEAMSGSYKGNLNTAVGYRSLSRNNEGSFNTSTGAHSLSSNSSGMRNVADGDEALYHNTSGSSNVGVGYQSLFQNITGVSNTATGTRALVSNTTGVNNSALGYGALLNNITGSQNTALGMLADVTAGNLFNATAIGYNAKVNASNKVRVGNSAVTKIEGQVAFSTPSDGRFKFNVKEDVQGLNFILKLRPVTYQFDINRFDGVKASDNVIQASYDKAIAIRRTGFIAQEVEKAAEESHYNFNGINRPESDKDHYSLSYESFVVPLVKGMQEQQAIIEKLQKVNDQLVNKLNELQQEINTIKTRQNK